MNITIERIIDNIFGILFFFKNSKNAVKIVAIKTARRSITITSLAAFKPLIIITVVAM